MGLLTGKRAVVFGVANTRSIAYGIASAFRREGAELAFSYASDAIRKRVLPIVEELGGAFAFPCDVTDDAAVMGAAETVRSEWGSCDILVHSMAFAPREALGGRYVDTSRNGFAVAMDVSVYSLTAICRAFEPVLKPGGSVIAMTYYGAQKVVSNYNVMGVAKAALESSVRYLAVDMGTRRVRVNAISSGPVKTLASSAISGFGAALAHVEEYAPLHRNVTTSDVGNTAVFLASDLASAVTGEVLFTDCGYNVMGMMSGACHESQR